MDKRSTSLLSPRSSTDMALTKTTSSSPLLSIIKKREPKSYAEQFRMQTIIREQSIPGFPPKKNNTTSKKPPSSKTSKRSISNAKDQTGNSAPNPAKFNFRNSTTAQNQRRNLSQPANKSKPSAVVTQDRFGLSKIPKWGQSQGQSQKDKEQVGQCNLCQKHSSVSTIGENEGIRSVPTRTILSSHFDCNVLPDANGDTGQGHAPEVNTNAENKSKAANKNNKQEASGSGHSITIPRQLSVPAPSKPSNTRIEMREHLNDISNVINSQNETAYWINNTYKVDENNNNIEAEFDEENVQNYGAKPLKPSSTGLPSVSIKESNALTAIAPEKEKETVTKKNLKQKERKSVHVKRDLKKPAKYIFKESINNENVRPSETQVSKKPVVIAADFPAITAETETEAEKINTNNDGSSDVPLEPMKEKDDKLIKPSSKATIVDQSGPESTDADACQKVQRCELNTEPMLKLEPAGNDCLHTISPATTVEPESTTKAEIKTESSKHTADVDLKLKSDADQKVKVKMETPKQLAPTTVKTSGAKNKNNVTNERTKQKSNGKPPLKIVDKNRIASASRSRSTSQNNTSRINRPPCKNPETNKSKNEKVKVSPSTISNASNKEADGNKPNKKRCLRPLFAKPKEPQKVEVDTKTKTVEIPKMFEGIFHVPSNEALTENYCRYVSLSKIVLLYPEGTGMAGSIRLSNGSPQVAFFRISACTPDRYSIEPKEGKIDPNRRTIIKLTTEAPMGEDEFQDDTFKIETVLTSADASSQQASRRFWMNIPQSRIQTTFTTCMHLYNPNDNFFKTCLRHSSKTKILMEDEKHQELLYMKENGVGSHSTELSDLNLSAVDVKGVVEDVILAQNELQHIHGMERINLILAIVIMSLGFWAILIRLQIIPGLERL